MKNYLFFIILSLFAVVIGGCDEEKDAPLQFEVIENSSPDITKIDYYSPNLGPFVREKEYFVKTDFSSSEVKLQCNNCGQITIDTKLEKPHTAETGGDTMIEATPEETGIYVSLSDGNVITVNFRQLDLDNPYGYYGTVTVFGKVDGKEEKALINLSRRNNQLDISPD